MNNLANLVLVSDTLLWSLPIFLHQWDKYYQEPLLICGYSRISPLPHYAKFRLIGKYSDFPVNKWSDSLINMVYDLKTPYVCIFLEDFWINRPVNKQAVALALEYISNNPHVVRLDLTTDRVFAKDIRIVDHIEWLDITTSPEVAYSFSTQASIWNRKILLDLLCPGETPWQTEMNGSTRFVAQGYQAYGTLQYPIHYVIGVNKGMIDVNGDWMYPPRRIYNLDELKERGFIK